MKELIQSIMSIGGFGYINYWLISRLNDKDLGSSEDKKFIIMSLSSLNYIIYLLIKKWIHEFLWSIIITVFISILLTFLFDTISTFVYRIINKFRSKNDIPKLSDELLWDRMFDDKSSNRFLFDLSGNLISSGVIESISGRNEEKSLIFKNYVGEKDNRPKTEEELMTYLDENDIQSSTYINLDKKIKIIYF